MEIQETAFIISTYRSYHEDISKDTYARLWNNPKTDALLPDILKNVSEHEAILHSLRNRFFYEKMGAFFEKYNGGTLINFGAGFSMYQFSLNQNVLTIEIDKQDIITYKKEKINHWMKQGDLPNRSIEYTSLDFNIFSEDRMVDIIKPLIKKAPVFILLEGVLFFLSSEMRDKLFRVFRRLQNNGDVIGSVSYLPEAQETEVYHRLLDYFDKHNDTNDSFMHQTTPISFYQNLEGYKMINKIDEFELSKIYAPKLNIKNKGQILNEHLYLLERN